MKRSFSTVLLYFFAALSSLSCRADDELYVLLGSENALLPLCVSEIDASTATLPKEYLKSLNDVLMFDLSHNGMTNAITGNERERVLINQPKLISEVVNLDALRTAELSYYIQTGCLQKTIKAKLYGIQANSVQTVDTQLTGDIGQDRRIIHKLSDAIFEALFQKPGVASSKLLFTVKKKSGSSAGTAQLFECDYDGKNIRQIGTSNALITCPRWIPSKNGAKSNACLYVSYQIGQPKLYYSSLKGEKPKRVTPMRGNQFTASVSPDGSLIVFASDITGTSDLFIVPFQKEVGAIGKPRHLFHAKGAACASPVFSPDGTKIAFVCNKDGSPKIYVMDVPEPTAPLAKMNPKLLTKKCKENSAPSWSLDGKKLAYSAKSSGYRQIWIYDFETGVEKQLTKGSENKENPSWGADSLHLVYNTSGSKNELFLINLNQIEPTRIVESPDDVQFAVFEP